MQDCGKWPTRTNWSRHIISLRDIAYNIMRGWLAHVTLWPPGRLTAHSLSLFLFQCFLALLVVLVEIRDACACTRGFSASRFCKDKCYFPGITHYVLTAYRTRTRPVSRTSMSGGSRETSLPDMTPGRSTGAATHGWSVG